MSQTKQAPYLTLIITIILITTTKTKAENQIEEPETSIPKDPKNYHEEAHHHHGSYVVNNDNEHHKALYKQNHQHHQQPSTTSRVLELSDRFLEIVNNVVPTQQSGTGPEEPRYQPWLVKFYAPWCGHCKRLEPIFNHVAQALHNTPIRVGKVDCTRFPSVGTEYKIHGYPTIMFISGPTHRITFQGDREVSQIVRFAKRMSSPPVTTSPLTLHKFIEKRIQLPPPPVLPQTAEKQSSSYQQQQRSKRSQESEEEDELNQQSQETKSADPLFFGIIKPIGYKDKLTSSYTTIARKYHQHNEFYEFQESSSHVTIFCMKSNRLVLYSSTNDPQANVTKNLESWIGTERFPDFLHLTRSNLFQLFSEETGSIFSKDYIIVGVVHEDKLNRIMDKNSKHLIELLKSVTNNSIIRSKTSNDLNLPLETTTRIENTYGWIGNPELANSIVAETLTLPTLLIIKKLKDNNHEYYVFSDYSKINTELKIENLIALVKENHFNPYVRANSFSFKLYRYLFDAKVSLTDMWVGNPVLTIVLFGLPLGFLSLILYSVCCGDIMDAKEEEFSRGDDDDNDGDDESGDEGENHEKRE